MQRTVRFAVFCVLALLAAPSMASAQPLRGTVVDQTGLPVPGATVQLLNGTEVVQIFLTDDTGTFVIDSTFPGDTVVVTLEGFEPTRTPRADATKIVLRVARATDTTTVIGSATAAAPSTTPLLGSTLTAATVARLPSSRMKARESLPLLPSVIRGADGLMQMGGARAYDTPLLLDGFNITDPATGLSSVNLPFEAVRSVEALRDPMSVTYGGLIGGLVRLESKPGADRFAAGVQGFVPRPRFTSPGFGRLEGIFPRAHVSGSSADGDVRYVAAVEYDYERIPVPDVTEGSGPDLVEQSAIAFARLDARLTPKSDVTVEGFFFPSSTQSFGLSPRRSVESTVNLSAQDLFAGVTQRFLGDTGSLFLIQIGVFTRESDSTPSADQVDQPLTLSPSGWTGGWFSRINRSARRYAASASWERVLTYKGRSHDVTFGGELASRKLTGTVVESPVYVTSVSGRTVRSVDFGASASFAARDWPVGLSLRDAWQATTRLQIDAGARIDHSRYTGGAPSARVGVRYALDPAGVTVLKAGYGSFVGNLPLAVPAFQHYPTRLERWFDGDSGELLREAQYQPRSGELRFPHALAATVGIERQLAPGLDAQIVLSRRRSSRIATIRLPSDSGDLRVESNGRGTYDEAQISLRRAWSKEQQLFVSYVRSTANGELNEFSALFRGVDAPLLQPGGMARSSNDARHRVLVWSTFNLPSRVVVSPVTEWRSGFPYSAVNERNLYVGSPNSRSFPNFLATDLVVYKTVTVKKRTADVGVQLFNVTNHQNPRDVHPVVTAPNYGRFLNSVGPILRGYMLLKW